MSQPYNPRREAFPADNMLDRALEKSDNLLYVDKILANMLMPENSTYRPSNADLKLFWNLYQTEAGKALIEWLLDMTVRAPYPLIGASFETAAIAAAKHQARAGIGEVLIDALALGKKLTEK